MSVVNPKAGPRRAAGTDKSRCALFAAALCLGASPIALVQSALAQAPAGAAQIDPTQAGDARALLPRVQRANPVIQRIQVQGNQRIEPETVASYLVVQPGQAADQQLIDLSLKTLFRTGLFADAAISMQPDGTLLVEVQENPIVNRVIFEGNRKVKEDKFTEEIQLAPRIVYTRAKVQSDVQRIIEVYRRTGRFAATVTPKVTPLDQNRVDVVFEVDEGPITGVAKINFIGNDVFSDGELRDVVLTEESRWWKFLTSNDNYDPDRLEYDRELLRQYYTRNGYADFSVVSAVAELTPDRKDFFITLTVEEGQKYDFGDVSVTTSFDKLDADGLEAFVGIKEGDTFNGEKIEKAVENLTFATGVTGYAFVDVAPRLERHPDRGVIDINFDVNEGPRVYVERININGNVRTLDKVIRREMRLTEGDAFNRILVDRSRQRIRALGFFGDVTIEEKPGTSPDRTVLDVGVEEQATGSFSIGAGISSTDQFIADIAIEERNLLGRGQFLRFRIRASSRTQSADLRFTEPYFLGRNLALGWTLFAARTDFRESFFVRNSYGFGLNTGFPISEYGRLGLRYTLSADNLEVTRDQRLAVPDGSTPQDVADDNLIDPTDFEVLDFGDAGTFIDSNLCNVQINAISPTCLSEGNRLTSLVGYTLSFDKRNDPIVPTSGWRAAVSGDFAGLGGSVQYLRGEVNGAIYQKIYRGFVGVLKGRAGYITGWNGDDVRINDRFFEGAFSFRGFEVAGVGPRFITDETRADGQSLGGRAYAIGTAEVLVPLPLPEEYGIRVSLFSDFGTVGLLDDSDLAFNDVFSGTDLNGDGIFDYDGDGIPDDPVQDDLSLRMTAGVSVNWNSPFGPVQFDFAEVIMQEDYDQTEAFRFSAGTNF